MSESALFLNEPDFSLLRSHNYKVVNWQRISGGGNNRLYKVITDKGVAVAKFYCDDERQRAIRDTLISQCFANAGISNIASPILSLPEHHFALFEFLEGEPCRQYGVKQVMQAADFIHAINKPNVHELLERDLLAADASFCLQGHIDNIQARIERLNGIDIGVDVDRQMIELLNNDLIPLLAKVVDEASTLTYQVEPEDRIISPSDFGFHNSLDIDGSLYFLDFEYAGWDDPAKLVADFFSHPAFHVSPGLLPDFIARAFPENPTPEFLKRLPVIIKILRIKWICIILNEFNQTDMARRAAALHCDDDTLQLQRKQRQLAKAWSALKHVEYNFGM